MRILLGAIGLVLLTVCVALSTGVTAAPLPPAGWGAGQSVATYVTENYTSVDYAVAMDPGGNATAVWGAPSTLHLILMGARYAPDRGWGPATVVAVKDGNVTEIDLAMDRRGGAMAVWQIDNGTVIQLWASYFAAGDGWQPAVRVDSDTGNTTEHAVAFDGNGLAWVIWRVRGPSLEEVWVSRFAPATGWTATTQLDSSPNYLSGMDIGADSGGNVISVWARLNPLTGWDIVARRYTPSAGWGAAIPLENDTGSAAGGKVAVSPDGNATVVWAQDDGSYYSAYAAQYVTSGAFGAGWSAAPTLLESATDHTFDVTVGAGPGGRAAVVWTQRVGTHYGVIATIYTPGVGWSGSAPIESGTNNTWGALPTYSDTGVITVVWHAEHYDASFNLHSDIWSNTYIPQRGWGTAALIESSASYAGYPSVASDASGVAIALWQESSWLNPGYTRQILSNRYVPPDITPPALTLTGPASGTVTTQPTVQVTGFCEAGVSLVINGVEAAVAFNGSFSLRVALAVGVNTITVTARDAWGNGAFASTTVTFTDLFAQLQQQLDARWAELNATRSDLDATRGQLNSTVASLNRTALTLTLTQAELDGIQGELTAAQQRIVATDDELNVTQLDLADTTADLTRTKSDLSATRNDLNATKTQLNLTQAELARTRDDLARTQTDLNATRVQLSAASSGVERTTKEIDQARTDLGSAQSLLIVMAIVAFVGVGLGAAAAGLAIRAGKRPGAALPPGGRAPPPPPAPPPPGGGGPYYPGPPYPPNRPY